MELVHIDNYFMKTPIVAFEKYALSFSDEYFRYILIHLWKIRVVFENFNEFMALE